MIWIFYFFLFKLYIPKIKLVIIAHAKGKVYQNISIPITKCNTSKTIAIINKIIDAINKPNLINPPLITKI